MINPISVPVKVFNNSGFELPEYKTAGAAAMDGKAVLLSEKVAILPQSWELIHTGLFVACPDGTEFQVRPRSGLALDIGLTILNSPGTIDSDYRGEIGLILYNSSTVTQTVLHGERLGQLALCPVYKCEWEPVDSLESLPPTQRGTGGFGHTNK